MMASPVEQSKTRAPEPGLKCPRCDSGNTKFCYYNNYSLAQPRYFCKTCRRYWTKGGALRNVPVGGGCRKSTSKSGTSRCSSFPFVPREHKFLLRGFSSIPDLHLPASGMFNLTWDAEDHLASESSAGAMTAPPFAGLDLAASVDSLNCYSRSPGLHWKLDSLSGDNQASGDNRPLQDGPISGGQDLAAGAATGWFTDRNRSYAAPPAEERSGEAECWYGNPTWSAAQQQHPFSALP